MDTPNSSPRNPRLAQEALARICNNTSEDPQKDAEIVESNFDAGKYLDVGGFLAKEGVGINSSWQTSQGGKIYSYRNQTDWVLVLKEDGTVKKTIDGTNIKKPVVNEYNNSRYVISQFKSLITMNHVRIAVQSFNHLQMMVGGNPQEIAEKVIKHWDEGDLSPEDINVSWIEFLKPRGRIRWWWSPKKSIGEFLAPIVEAAYQRIDSRQAYTKAIGEFSGADLVQRLETRSP